MSRKTAEAAQKVGKAVLTIHNPRIVDFHAPIDRPDPALAVVPDAPKRLTIGAIPARKDIGLTLLFDHKLLQAGYDRFAIGKPQADLPIRQSAEFSSDHHFRDVAAAEFVHTLDRDLPPHRRSPSSRRFLHR
jgi:hypothetical protein